MSAVDWPGRGPVRLYLAHATGFCKEIWEPLVDELRSAGVDVPVTAWDAPFHGDTSAPLDTVDWWDSGRAALTVVSRRPEKIRLGVGHSMGGAALVLAELLAPGTFDALLLVEPIIFPPPYQRIDDHPLAAGAARRRASFSGPDEAFENFAAKPAFARWDERALRAYVRGGLAARGGRWWLKCRPDHEAETYRAATLHGAYARLDEVSCPVTVLAGADSDSHPEEFTAHLAGRFSNGRHRVVEGAGHFLPMELPARLAREIARELDDPPGP